MLIRAILPAWALEESPSSSKVIEGDFEQDTIDALNKKGYNIYGLPNSPSEYAPGAPVTGAQVDQFNFVFADFDLKSGNYANKEDFISYVRQFPELDPTLIVDSGNGIHLYWNVSDLDAMSYLRLQRRIVRKFNTDPAVGQIYQLMRTPGTVNTKHKDAPKLCAVLAQTEKEYTCEELDKRLPPITPEDEAYCQQHYAKTYRTAESAKVDDRIPVKFAKLLRTNKEVADIWRGGVDDRSKADYRLGHIMLAAGFTREEAMSVLVNAAKALERAPAHRVGYAEAVVDKIWTFETAEDKDSLDLSKSVREILQVNVGVLKGTRLPCSPWVDNTEHGFRLGQVVGLVAGSGVGKTAVSLNMFLWFAERNPEYDHFFVPLEQPANEIADRWRTMCGEDSKLHDKVHIISNYADDGGYRNLSLDDILQYLVKFQRVTGRKIGCVVIDHIGALKKKGAKSGENQDLMDICHAMKAFAVQTNTLLVMQSQAPREKAGVGDLELNKDAAYGTVFFESYVDYLMTIWQPLKRVHAQPGCPTVTAFKFCKIRHKNQKKDAIQEDVRYRLYFDSEAQHLMEMTQGQEQAFDFFNKKAVNERKADRKTEILQYTSVKTEV